MTNTANGMATKKSSHAPMQGGGAGTTAQMPNAKNPQDSGRQVDRFAGSVSGFSRRGENQRWAERARPSVPHKRQRTGESDPFLLLWEALESQSARDFMRHLGTLTICGNAKFVLNRHEKNGMTLLDLAIKVNAVVAVEALLHHGADMTLPGEGGRFPLFAAMLTNSPEMVAAFCRHAAARADNEMLFAQAYDQAINSSMSAEDFVRIIRLGVPINFLGLKAAVWANKPEFLRSIIDELTNRRSMVNVIVNQRDKNVSDTLLEIAVKSNFEEIADILVRSGAKVNAGDLRGIKPLYHAASLGHAEMVKLLVNRNAVIDAKNGFFGETPLKKALKNREFATARSLVGLGADVFCSSGFDTLSPFFASAVDLEAMKSIFSGIMDLGRDVAYAVNVANEQGHTLLQCVLDGDGDPDKIALLLQHGAELLQRDQNGLSLLHYAVRGGQKHAVMKIVAALEERGRQVTRRSVVNGERGDVLKEALQQLAYNSLTPLGMALFENHHDIAEYLIDAGSDINEKSAKGYSLLFRSVCFGPGQIAFLVDRGANVTIQREEVLHWTCNMAELNLEEKERVVEDVVALILAGAGADERPLNAVQAGLLAQARTYAEGCRYARKLLQQRYTEQDMPVIDLIFAIMGPVRPKRWVPEQADEGDPRGGSEDTHLNLSPSDRRRGGSEDTHLNLSPSDRRWQRKRQI